MRARRKKTEEEKAKYRTMKKLHPLIKDSEPEKLNLLKPSPITDALLKSMPPHLKDPKNFEKIQRALLDTLAGRHSHAEVFDWAKCKTCMGKRRDHALMMRKLGFTSGAMYLVWKKIHTKIQDFQKVRFPKYNTK